MISRTFIAILHDIAAAALAWLFAYLLRFNFEIPDSFIPAMWSYLVWVIPVQTIAFQIFRLYRGVWRFASIPDLRRIALAVGTAALATPALLYLIHRLTDVPRSVLLLDPILLFFMMGGSRFLYRAWKEGYLISPQQLGAEPVIVLGAGAAAVMLLRDLAHNPNWRPVALLDDDAQKIGLRLLNVSVLGRLDSIQEHAKRLEATHAIVAMPSATVGERRRATELAVNTGLKVMTVPSMSDVLAGKVAVSQIRRIELEDLLGRDPVQLDDEGLQEMISGKVVLVTGAGGLIGSELCRQIARFSPSLLVFYEVSEYSMYQIEQEFSAAYPRQKTQCIVGDVKDAVLLDRVFARVKPALVFHAAAYKHVPLMESENAWQAVRNNVCGTLCVARAAMRNQTPKLVLISTDKAVNPTNVMGATKRLAELACQAAQAESSATCIVAVRFGNVLGSSGSVIPKFREQIAKGGPVTVTHQDIVRYFMLIPEAAQLVLQAGLFAGQQNECGQVFVLDMGEPIRIVDLARDMIRLSGFSDDEVRIEITGLRPGEKLYEELLADSETTLPTPHAKLRLSKPEDVPNAEWLAELEAWLQEPLRDEVEVKLALQKWVPEYKPAMH